MNRFYRIQQFAELARVSVKTLRHYDRLGLLKPKRTDGGYRQYTDRDLERLGHIRALKFLGVPLRQISHVLDRSALDLAVTLELQRRTLGEQQRFLSLAVRAIRVAEGAIRKGRTVPAILKQVLEVIDMHDDIGVMKKYYSTDEAWSRARRYYEEGHARQFVPCSKRWNDRQACR